LDVCGEKEEQSAAYLRVPPGKRGDCGVCPGEAGHKDGKNLRERIKEPGISYDRISTDIRYRFLAVFRENRHLAGKAGFSEVMPFLEKVMQPAFDMAFFYINHGFV
jgi:hypothetical protein